MELDARKQTILQALIFEYVGNAEPVGSEMLTRKYDLGGKAATVRNEMAEMLELGFLEQPHTSAGRIPSDQGYRFYVDHLIVPSVLEGSTQTRLNATALGGEALQGILRDTARALSRLTRLLTVATTYRDNEVAVMSAQFSALGPQKGLAVFVLSNGTILNRMIGCPPGLTLEDIGAANEEMARTVVTKSLQTVIKSKPPSTGNSGVDRLLGTVWPVLRAQLKELTKGLLVTEARSIFSHNPNSNATLPR